MGLIVSWNDVETLNCMFKTNLLAKGNVYFSNIRDFPFQIFEIYVTDVHHYT